MINRVRVFVKAQAFKTLAFVIASIWAISLPAQEVSNKMVAPDSSVILSVARVNGEIFIEMDLSPALVFDHVTIERRPEFQSSFSQCLYVTYSEAKSKDMHVVKKDNYPYHNSAMVSYRVKIITREGERTYSPVLLPSAGH